MTTPEYGLHGLRPPARSMGLKLLLVCVVALLMCIPAYSVYALIYDRSHRAEQVMDEISGLVGGPQTFLGPTLVVPYSLTVPADGDTKAHTETGSYVVSPKTGDATATLDTGVKRRGLFKAVTWTSDIAFTSDFDLAEAGAQAPKGAVLDWSRAEVVVGASDARGAQTDVLASLNQTAVKMVPATSLSSLELAQPSVKTSEGRRNFGPNTMRFFSAPAGGIAQPGGKFQVTSKLKFAGAQRLAVLAFAETTTFHASGNWADPSYDGGFLPVGHTEKNTGKDAGTFKADWSVPYIARGVPGEGYANVITKLGETSLGVSLVEKANPYQAVSRSLKYALMFLGLVFLAYFMFETTQKKRVHPAQYVLIGLAQIIFYLLLLSLAERIGFDLGFLASAGATVGLISAYAGWVFNSAKQGYVALVAFTALYGLIYILMRLEDWALLVGAVTSFAAIASVMYFTRNIDWYGSDSAKAGTEAPRKAD